MAEALIVAVNILSAVRQARARYVAVGYARSAETRSAATSVIAPHVALRGGEGFKLRKGILRGEKIGVRVGDQRKEEKKGHSVSLDARHSTGQRKAPADRASLACIPHPIVYAFAMERLLLLCAFLLASCASNPHHAKYGVEKNAPKFANTRSYVEEPAVVRTAARAALDSLNHESDPPTTGSIKDGDVMRTGWVYGVSKNRFVEYKVAGKPGRKELRYRRKYGYGITPSLAGTDVSLQVEEESMQVDLRTGEEKGWKSVEADPAAYDMLARRLTDQLRQR
jgi:hypothetical protein